MYYYKHNSVKQWPKIIEDLTQDLTLTLLMDNSYYVYCTSEFKFNELITLVFKIHSKDFFIEGAHTSWKDLLECLSNVEKYSYIYILNREWTKLTTKFDIFNQP